MHQLRLDLGLDTSARQGAPFPPSPAQPQSSQSSAVPSKWAPPDRPGIAPSSETSGVRSIPPLPTKWTPPSGSTNPQGSPPPQGIPRPGPMPMRPPLPPTQGGPRPSSYKVREDPENNDLWHHLWHLPDHSVQVHPHPPPERDPHLDKGKPDPHHPPPLED